MPTGRASIWAILRMPPERRRGPDRAAQRTAVAVDSHRARALARRRRLRAPGGPLARGRLFRRRRPRRLRRPLPRLRALPIDPPGTLARPARALPAASGRLPRACHKGDSAAARRLRDRRVGDDVGCDGARARRRGDPGRDRARRRLPGRTLVQHLSAPFRGDPAGLAARCDISGRLLRDRSAATAGRSSRRRRSSFSRGRAIASGRCRSRERVPPARARTFAPRRRTPPST